MIRVKDFKKKATIRQKFLLYRLKRFANEEEELKKEINDVYESLDVGEYTRLSQELQEMVINDILTGLENHLEKVQKKISHYLESSVKLGMEEVDIIALNYREYVNVP